MSKNVLQFSDNGTEFHFIFADGGESFEITSKEAGFKTIMDLLKKSKISVVEFGEFQKQITQAENLPWNEPEKDNRNRSPFGFGLLGGILSSMAKIEVLSSILDLANAPKEPVEVAYFKMCDCGGNHGRIYFQTGYTGEICSKEHAMNYVDELKKKELINDKEVAKVREEFASSKLPDK